MLTRLDRVKPFVLQETMVPAAALSPAAQVAIERYLTTGRRELRGQIRSYVKWIKGSGRDASPVQQQRRFTLLRLRFNRALTQLDLFSDAITQRSEHETGVWLNGLDEAASDALQLPGRYFDPPPMICYLHRGLGGAIRRAQTRLPGGGENPVSIIRIPRERMIGYGIASSLVHEVGHQAAALLNLVMSVRPALQRLQQRANGMEKMAWQLWERWISEILADTWSIARVGVASTLGLIGVVSLPRSFIFRVNVQDPHPFPWIRVKVSCAVGQALYPNPQWAQIAAMWESFYPLKGLDAASMKVVRALNPTIARLVRTILEHRPPSLRGRTLGQVIVRPERTPERLAGLYREWQADPERMKGAPPTLTFAVFGQARANGLLTPERENRSLGRLITHWAVRSTLEEAGACAMLEGLGPKQRTPTSGVAARSSDRDRTQHLNVFPRRGTPDRVPALQSATGQ